MYNLFSKSYFHTLKRISIALLIACYALPSAAQFEQDTLLLKFFGNETEVKKWKSTQKDAYSFDHLLQKPAVAKHYKNKKFGDHLFIEGGIQGFSNISRKGGNGIHFDPVTPWGYGAVGDWVTPLHGWRISLQAGNYMHNNQRSKVLGASADYLLNLTAVAAQEYDQPKRFEVYGVAGADFFRSEGRSAVDYSYGLHFGLRGQLHFNPYTYLFIEPRVGIYTDDFIHTDSWRKYIVTANALAGIGYRLNPVKRLHTPYPKNSHFLDNSFISASLGLSDMLNIGSRWGVSRQLGALGQISVGKWFNPYSALRLTAGAALHDQPKDYRVKAIQAGIGYMWNMHNTFGGYKPDRKYWINAVADVHASLSTSGHGRKTSLGFGAGLQPTVRVARGVELFLEPRIDFYDKNYASHVGENTHFDAFGSLLAGITFRQGDDSRDQIGRNDDFEQKSWFDNLFVEGSVGGILPLTRAVGKDIFKHIGANSHVGVGKWFNATSGTRLWGEVGFGEEINDNRFKLFGIGADYLWNLTNAFHGYVQDRRCELIAAAGINTVANMDSKKFYFGGNVSLKGLWHLNDMLGLYLEPQLRVYNSNFMKRSSLIDDKVDAIGLMMAGVQLRMNGYRPGAYSEAFESNERNSFVSVAAGIGSNLDQPRTKEQYAASGRISYGRWFAPAAAWRVNANGMIRPKQGYRHAMTTLGADYMTDLTTLAYGYNPDRILSVRYFLGTNMGMEYKGRTDGHLHFVADVHTGGQLAVRVGSKNELFVEPQLAYNMGKMQRGTAQLKRLQATAYAGITHKLRYDTDKEKQKVNSDCDDFVSLSLGTGVNTRNILYSSPRARRLTVDYDASYGHWFNTISAVRGGVTGSTLFLHRKQKNLQLTTLHLDYMMNILTLVSGEDALDQPWEFNAFAGVTCNIGSGKKIDSSCGWGGQLGLQAGYKFTRHWELIAEGSANLMSKKAWKRPSHKFEALGHFMLGTKYNF